MKNEMGKEGEGENSPNLDPEVEEGERKKMVCLVSLGRLSIHTCKKENEEGRRRRSSSSCNEEEKRRVGLGLGFK